jgi:DNA-binding transcriptional ArsR family regulator
VFDYPPWFAALIKTVGAPKMHIIMSLLQNSQFGVIYRRGIANFRIGLPRPTPK